MKYPSKQGATYGALTLTGIAETRGSGVGVKIFEQCFCVCGSVCFRARSALALGRVAHCGCLTSQNTRAAATTHGLSLDPAWRVWYGMRNRCNNPHYIGWKRYGGRGIKVCEEWSDFSRFLAYVGPRPSNAHSIDRFPDNNGNYEPGNVRWATRAEQGNNQSTNHLVERDGIIRTVTEWSRATGISRRLLGARLRKGWTVEAAFSPVLTKRQVSARALAARYGKPQIDVALRLLCE